MERGPVWSDLSVSLRELESHIFHVKCPLKCCQVAKLLGNCRLNKGYQFVDPPRNPKVFSSLICPLFPTTPTRALPAPGTRNSKTKSSPIRALGGQEPAVNKESMGKGHWDWVWKDE